MSPVARIRHGDCNLAPVREDGRQVLDGAAGDAARFAGRRPWPGLSAGAEASLEPLVTWPELGYNMRSPRGDRGGGARGHGRVQHRGRRLRLMEYLARYAHQDG